AYQRDDSGTKRDDVYRSIDKTVISPSGSPPSKISPTRAPITATAKGARMLIKPLAGSASSTPTMRKVCWRPLRSIVTSLPNDTALLDGGGASSALALRTVQ